MRASLRLSRVLRRVEEFGQMYVGGLGRLCVCAGLFYSLIAWRL